MKLFNLKSQQEADELLVKLRAERDRIAKDGGDVWFLNLCIDNILFFWRQDEYYNRI